MTKARENFEINVEKALNNPFLQSALDQNAERRKQARSQGYASLPQGFEVERKKAHHIKRELIDNWDEYLEKFIHKTRENGFHVHLAHDALTAQQIVEHLIKEADAKIVVKSKTMVGEEIQINEAILRAGAVPIETDLGEYIVQLREEPPAHIITPAVHLRREDVAQTFTENLGVPYNPDVKVMTNIARKNLRNYFITADVGISGVNFGVVETGSLCILSNEGNARMATTLPKMHIALLGMERLVPTLEDLNVFMSLLPRSATGQKITNYVSFIQAPRKQNEADGSDERHLILIDNGRKRIAETNFTEVLYCIRCGACLNVCPVFREIGGHAYNSAYPGPIGSILSPLLFGVEGYGHLAKASSLCGACESACPVAVPFSHLLPQVREKYVSSVKQPLVWTLAMKVFALVSVAPSLFGFFQKVAGILQPIFPQSKGWSTSFPALISRWTRSRDFPMVAKRSFRQRYKDLLNKKEKEPIRKGEEYFTNHSLESSNFYQEIPKQRYYDWNENIIEVFRKEWELLGGVFISCKKDQFEEKFFGQLQENQITSLLGWNFEELPIDGKTGCNETIKKRLYQEGIVYTCPKRDHKGHRQYASEYAEAQAGISGAAAAFAESGTIVVPSGNGMPLITSLMPPIHFVVLQARDIFPTMEKWLKEGGKKVIKNRSNVVFISGPSRTADIEMTLTIGVHGPGKVILFCIDDD